MLWGVHTIRNETLRVSEFMSQRRMTQSCSGRHEGHHLWPIKIRSANLGAPRAVSWSCSATPLAVWHNLTARPGNQKSTVYLMSTQGECTAISGGPRCVSRDMREIPSEMEFHGFLRRRSRAGASETAIETRIGQGS